MKTSNQRNTRRFQLKILSYADSYYIKRIAELEKALARKPRALQLDLVGSGGIPAAVALLIRAVLLERSPKTQIITAAHSSLQGGSVLVWLLGDRRTIRADARLFFRHANLSEVPEIASENEAWKETEPNEWDSFSEIDPEEGDYARVLELINEFLPVKELAGRLIGVPVLRQFGLVENESVDRFLAAAFKKSEPDDSANITPDKQPPRKPKTARSRSVRK